MNKYSFYSSWFLNIFLLLYIPGQETNQRLINLGIIWQQITGYDSTIVIVYLNILSRTITYDNLLRYTATYRPVTYYD